MDSKQLRTEVVNFLTEKQPDSDLTQNTKVLLKRAVKLGFIEPQESQEQNQEVIENQEQIETEIISQEQEVEPEIIQDINETMEPKKTRKPREKKTEVIETQAEEIKTPEKQDNSILWILAIALLAVVVIYFIKRKQDGNSNFEQS